MTLEYFVRTVISIQYTSGTLIPLNFGGYLLECSPMCHFQTDFLELLPVVLITV